MFIRGGDSFEIWLRNAEGIPVIHLGGTVTRTTLKAIRSMLESLAKAGHYNIVLNVERVQASNWSFLAGLADSVCKIRSHYGAVDLVAARDRIQQLLRTDGVARLFRLCRSESEAIFRIKRLHRLPDGVPAINARILEQP